jgi:hypothetical protein
MIQPSCTVSVVDRLVDHFASLRELPTVPS